MQRYRKLTTICAAAVLALGLAACGGGGDDDTADAPTVTEPTPTDQIAALVAQINALRAELGMGPVDIDALEGDVASLQGQVTDLQGQITTRDAALAAAARAAMTAQGKAVFGVLDTAFPETAFTADVSSPTAEVATTPPTVMASHGKATRVTAANLETFVEALSAISTDTLFTSAQTGAPETLSANNGFSGTMLTWSSTSKADTMTVYTDIAAPRGALFSERHGDADGDGTLDGGQVLGLGDGTVAHTGVTGTAFDGRDGGTVTHEPNTPLNPGESPPTVVKLPGAYKGASGSYQCTGAACSTSVNTNGSITFSTGWTFTANTGAMVSVADSAYMNFGWWMRDNKGTARILDHVAVFFNAPHPDDLAITTLTGKASYEGAAAGKYAWRDRVQDTAHGGHFTAKASLSADFAANDADGMMSGTISDFRIGDDGMDPNWTVTLSEAAMTAAGEVARGTDNVTWAVGSVKANSAGSWQAQLSDSGAMRNDNLPTGVAGAFDASFNEQGRMLGAFGANITNPNPPN